MTRRLALAIFATTVAALVLAGAFTLAIAAGTARRETKSDLVSEVQDVSASLQAATKRAQTTDTLTRAEILAVLRRALRLDDIGVLSFGPAGRTTDTPPAPLSIDDLQIETLLAGDTVSGSKGSLVFAASGTKTTANITTVVVLTRRSDAGIGKAARWFVVAAIVTIGLAAAVAVTLGRRLAKPVREAQLATHRIAAGELSTRLPEPTGRSDELSDLTRSINAMAATLERSQGLEQQFLLSVSHDLRTPLTSIRGYAEAITDGAGDPKASAQVIMRESRRLERLVRDLLDLAKLEQRQFTLRPAYVDLSDVAAATAEGFEPDAAASSVRVLTDIGGSVSVWADTDRLAQVAANLVENAIKHARSNVTVRTAAEGSSAVLIVDDDGPGIAPEDLPHVFERLYVSRHAPTRKEAGSGLGLAIVRELVHAMAGTVEAQPNPLGGARMVVRLPAASLPAPL
ncbi:MAG: sensor histidine kinase [Acidimicrobiia bacterium]